MKIAISGSMQFGKEMLEIKKNLESFGHITILPKDIERYASGDKKIESKWDKIEGDLIRNYYEEIKRSDALFVVNLTKNGVENYIGGNGLIEIAFGHILNKKIYLLNPIPKINYSDEIEAMCPEILNGDLSKIPVG